MFGPSLLLFRRTLPGTRSHRGGRPRHTGRGRFAVEVLEERLTPTTLLPGFAETPVVSGLSSPTAMEFAPDGRLFVLEQAGNVELVRADGTTWTALHLNVDSDGRARAARHRVRPRLRVESLRLPVLHQPECRRRRPGRRASTTSSAGSPWTTPTRQQPIFTNEAPILDWNNLSAATNHNGGAIHFGLDGMLYADAGDNVQTFTQGGNTYRVSQTLSNLLGKQLRIDVGAFNRGVATRDDTAVGHLIPADNPFVGTATGINQLIYALGLRNPFTFAVQPGTGTIFINDVGETTWEEIDRSVAGRQLRLERRQHRRLRPFVPARSWRLSRPAARLQPLGRPGRRRHRHRRRHLLRPGHAAIPGLLRRQVFLRRPRRRLDPRVRPREPGHRLEPRHVTPPSPPASRATCST